MDMIKKKLLLLGITVPMLLLSADVAAQHPHDGHYRPDTTALKRTQRLGEVVVRGKYVDPPTSTWPMPSTVWRESRSEKRAA